MRARELRGRVEQLIVTLADERAAHQAAIEQAAAQQAAHQAAAQRDAARQSKPLDPDLIEAMAPAKLAELAQSLAMLRPLALDPDWKYGSDWDNPDPAFRARRQLWELARRRGEYIPIVMPWHEDTRFALRVGSNSSIPLYVGGCTSPNEFVFLRRFLRTGMTFVDVGANEGLFSIFAAKCVGSSGSVWAFEPSRREFALLEHNLELNHLHARLFPCALAETNGSAEFKVAAFGNEGLNTLGEFAYRDTDEGERYVVELKRLDDVIALDPPARVDLIKIDVEGAELRVLQGAEETLRRYRPVLLFEALEAALQHQGASVAQLVDFVRGCGYSIFVFDSQTGLPSPASGDYSENLLAVPEGMSLA